MTLGDSSSKRTMTFDTVIERETVISPQDYLELIAKEPEKIVRSRIVAPSLGGEDFGGISVEWASPRYRLLDNIG